MAALPEALPAQHHGYGDEEAQEIPTRHLKAVFTAPGREWALYAAREVVARGHGSHAAVAEWIEDSIEDDLACIEFPQSRRRRISTTNCLEHFDQELKRRTLVVSFPPAFGWLALSDRAK